MSYRVRKPRHLRIFLRSWLRNPLKMGAIVPSSRFLARAMASLIDVHAQGHVVELGAGTGVVTQALLRHGIKPERLVVVERDRRLAQHLSAHFPHAHIIRGDACALKGLLEQLHVTQVNAVVSSLPLLSLPPRVQTEIVSSIADVIGEHGTLIQFTYSRRPSIPRKLLKRYALDAHRSHTVWLNMPPATVWIYSHRKPGIRSRTDFSSLEAA